MITGKACCERGERCSGLSLGGRGRGGMDTRIGAAGSLHGPPETITTLLIGYTAIQNKKFTMKYSGEERKEGLLYMINMQINMYIIQI